MYVTNQEIVKKNHRDVNMLHWTPMKFNPPTVLTEHSKYQKLKKKTICQKVFNVCFATVGLINVLNSVESCTRLIT